jgi:xylulokinase
VIGGGARSRYWGQVIAAAMEVELVYLQGGEVGPALGAARLAQLGVDGGDPADICVAPTVSHTIAPDPALVSALAEKKAAFRQAYSRITLKS